jgi:hypothetical protein
MPWVLAAALLGGTLAWLAPASGRVARLLVALLPLATLVLAAQMAVQLAAIPDSDMNASRTTPAVALARGFPIYAGPDGGPIIDFMYGPLAAVAFLPVAVATTPSGALLIAAVVNVLAFFLPMLWLHALVLGASRIAVAAMLCFGLLVLHDLGLRFSAMSIHADAPSLGLAAVACLALMGSRPRLAMSALFAALAVWTKQTTVPLLVALPLWVAATWGLRRALVYVVWLALALALVSAVLLAVFGIDDVVFNMVTLPGHMPWYDETTQGRWPAAMRSLGWLLYANALPAAIVVGVLVLDVRRGDGVRGTLQRRPWLLLVLVAVAMAPLAVVGGAKIGGYLNTHSVTSYFLLAAATCALGAFASAGSRRRTVGEWVLVGLLAVLVLPVVLDPRTPAATAAAVTRLAHWSDNQQEQAFVWARRHPGTVYLPWNPLVTLLAEGRLDHSEIGAWNRDLAGVPIGDAQLRRFVPRGARLLAVRPRHDATTWLPDPTARLPEFHERTTEPGLPGWDVFARDAAEAP